MGHFQPKVAEIILKEISFFTNIQKISTSVFAPKLSHAEKAVNKERIEMEIHSWLRRTIVGQQRWTIINLKCANFTLLWVQIGLSLTINNCSWPN